MKSQRGFLLPIIIIVLVLGLGGGVYLSIKNSENKSTPKGDTPAVVETDTQDTNTNPSTESEVKEAAPSKSDWQTFFDQKLKVGFSYPSYLSIEKTNIAELSSTNSDFIKITLSDPQNGRTEIVFPVDASSRLNGEAIKVMLVEGSKTPDEKGRPKTLTVGGKIFYITYDDAISYSTITNRGIVDVSFPVASNYSQSDIKQMLSSLKY